MAVRIKIKGIVQGVGFRPFVYRTAKKLGIKGFVCNTTDGVVIEAEGEGEALDIFKKQIIDKAPPVAEITCVEISYKESEGFDDFYIKESKEDKEREPIIPPDMSLCEECERELFDPKDRRFLYPFITCVNCGPRFTIIEAFPYDRENTTMKKFKMCPQCKEEYEDPLSRRFHTQPIGCYRCGPEVWLSDREGNKLETGIRAIDRVSELIERGYIIGVKGIGGFHLVCDATREEAVSKLRERKKRKEKPFAVMFRDLEQLKEYLKPSEEEIRELTSCIRPIVLIEKKKDLAPSVAPGLRRIGAFLPYSPLHLLILKRVKNPVIATSGNISGEPIVRDNGEAIYKLRDIADFFLLHNRDIRRRCDDSVIKLVGGTPTPIRRSRGFVPRPVKIGMKVKRKVLGVGGMLKNTFAFNIGDKVIISQHIGDIENTETLNFFEDAVRDLTGLYGFKPDLIVCDLHPLYETTKWAEEKAKELNIPLIKLQHHHAHILSCMAEKGIRERVLGIAWDGTGYGTDGSVWGGEFLLCDLLSFERIFHLKPFPLMGGDRAVKEPLRVVLSLIFEMYGEEGINILRNKGFEFDESFAFNLFKIWKRKTFPLTSSAGRLIDAVGFILGIKDSNTYEGQIAVMMEDLYDPLERGEYPFEIRGKEIDWRDMIDALLKERDKRKGVSRFINTLVNIGVKVGEMVGEEKICLSGGVMQNDPLVTNLKEKLEERGFKVFTQTLAPPNDGGLSLGQVYYGLNQ